MRLLFKKVLSGTICLSNANESVDSLPVKNQTRSSKLQCLVFETLKSVSPPPAGAILYRVPLTWGQNKRPWKLLHGALMLLALVLAVVGLCAVFDFHNANAIPNLYSLHSWVGVATVALFAAQVAAHKPQNAVRILQSVF